MEVNVKYFTEFGMTSTTMEVNELASFIKKYNFKISSIEEKEKSYSEEEVRKLLLAQRGNCYVAILTKTRDEELAIIASSAPEPAGKDGWVKK